MIFIISCRKHEDMVADCISEVTVDSADMTSTVTSPQLAAIDNLFKLNNLSTANEQFFGIDSNRYMPPGYNDSVSQVEVLAYRWYNNLPVFMWNDNLVFYNDILQPISIIYHGQVPGPDTTFHQSLESLRKIYQANFLKIIISGGVAITNNNVRHPSSGYLDSCLTAQPGYIDPVNFNQASTYGSSLIKAWKVTPVGSAFPMVFIADSTGAAWPVSIAVP